MLFEVVLNYTLVGCPCWLTKFVQEVANKNGDRYPSRSLYGIVCGLERYLEDVNGGNVLNPLDSSHKR